MQNNNFLNKLLAIEPAGSPFISLYLNTEPNENGKKDFDIFLKKQISEHAGSLPDDSDELKSFEADSEKINEFLNALRPSARGVAIFACNARSIFQASDFDAAFPEDLFFVNSKPHLFPLVRMIEQNPMFAVVAADTNAASIYVFRGGQTIDKEEIQNEKTNRTEVGGWSQMRFQRSVENFHEQHAKEVVAELDKIVREFGIKRILLCGDEAVVIPLLRQELTKELKDKVIGSIRKNVHTPEHEILEAAEHEMRIYDTLEDKSKVDNLIEQNYDGGIGVAGVNETLKALLNGQVQELYISSDFGNIDYNVGAVSKLLKDYAPGEDGELPNAKDHGMIVDELLRRGSESADNIRFIEDASLLQDLGGVGALLRYQAKGVTNK